MKRLRDRLGVPQHVLLRGIGADGVRVEREAARHEEVRDHQGDGMAQQDARDRGGGRRGADRGDAYDAEHEHTHVGDAQRRPYVLLPPWRARLTQVDRRAEADETEPVQDDDCQEDREDHCGQPFGSLALQRQFQDRGVRVPCG